MIASSCSSCSSSCSASVRCSPVHFLHRDSSSSSSSSSIGNDSCGAIDCFIVVEEDCATGQLQVRVGYDQHVTLPCNRLLEEHCGLRVYLSLDALIRHETLGDRSRVYKVDVHNRSALESAVCRREDYFRVNDTVYVHSHGVHGTLCTRSHIEFVFDHGKLLRYGPPFP